MRGDLLKQLQPARIDLSFRNRIAQRAARFMSVAAIVKAALAEISGEFDESLFYSAEAQMMQAECLYTGAIDQSAIGIDTV